METWIGEFKREVSPRLSSPRLAENQATFGLFALAHQLLHLARTLTDAVENRDARSSVRHDGAKGDRNLSSLAP